MKGKVNCTCGWSWNKSDSSKKDMYICHECGRDNSNNMKNGGWLDSISKAQEGDTVNNATQEGIDALQSIYRNNGPSTMFGRLPFNVGSGIGLLQSHINNKPEKLSDQIGIFPNPYAQAASYMALYAEKEGENIRKFNENKYRGKDLSELAPEEDVNNRVIDKTYVPKPKVIELKENKKETKSKKVSYKEKKETNKVEIDNTRTVKPKVNTNYKPESKPKTKYKFDIPSITYSDKSFVMPREVNDTKIDNTYVAKPRRKNGGWLDQYADGGNIDDPNVGDPNPTYWKSKVYKGPTEFNECKGEGCSKQATKGVASLYNLDYSSLNPQDAWYKRSAVIKGGGKEIYNVSSKNDINSVYGDLRVGDFVSLDRPGESHSTDVSKVEGYDLSDNEKTEHLGYVVGFDKNGTPLIKHGWEGNLISGAKSYVQPITNISLPDIGYDYTVNSIYRASPLLNNDKEVSSKYYKNISPSIPLSFNNEKNLTDDKQKFIDAYNKNSDKFQVETGLLPEEVAAIGNISYGIFGNESRFNESLKRPVKQLGAETLDFFGLKDTPPSLGPTQIKYDQVGGDKNNTRKSKLLRSLGVKKEDLNNVILPTDYDAVSKATFALLAENYRNLKTNPKFKYNSETNTVLGNVPIGVALAKSWQNPSLKNVEETLQTGNSDYANSVYKNMSELEGNMFPIELEEVVVQGKKKKNGGWLDSYEDGGTMQEHQENYNDYKVSAPEGFQGTGYSNVGRNYSPAWGGQFQNGGKAPLYLESENDPGYKAYQDSVSLYNHTLSRFKEPWASDKKFKKTVNSNKNSKEYKEALKKYYDEDVKKSNIKPTSIIFSDRKKDTYIPVFKKPQQEVIVKPTTTKQTTKPNDRSKKRKPTEKEIKEWSEPGFKLNSVTDYIDPKTKKVTQSWYGDLTRNEQAIQNNIQPEGIQNDFNIEAPIPVIRPQAIMPKSFDVTSQRQTMSGPSDYYNYDQQGLSVEQAAEVMRAAEAFNQSIQDKYGNSKNPKAQERYNQLMQNVEVTPNYQMGGKLKSNIPVIEDAGGYNEDGYWVPDWEAMTAQAKKLGAKRVKTKHGSLIVFDNNWEVIGVDDNPDAMQMGGNVYPVNYVPQAQDGEALYTPENWEKSIRNIEHQIGNPNEWSIDGYRQLQKQVNDYKFWRENTPEGKAVYDSHNESNEYAVPLPDHLKMYKPLNMIESVDKGYNTDAMRGMMKSKIGMGNAFNHPAIKRMSQAMPKTGMTPEGIGTHYMSSVDNYAVPELQDLGEEELTLLDPDSRSREAIRFNSPEEAQYFAEHYKDVAPMSNTYKGLQEYAMGGSMPGSVGFTYARTKGIPSNGPYAKKTLPSAQNGQEMSYYQNGLDWKPKTISRQGSVIKDDMGYWNPENWNSPVEIGSNNITMQDVPFDVLGISDEGDVQHMKANSPKNYKYKGNKVTEFRMAKNGMRQEQKGLVNLDQLTNFTNYNKPQPGGWLNKYN